MKRRGITIPRVVQRQLGSHHISSIEARRQSLQVDEAADQQSCPRDQHNGQSDFAADQ
jgi:hypothetical protein